MIAGGAVVLGVGDVGRAARFYIETLGMKLVAETARGTSIIDAGEGFHIELAPKASGSPSPEVHLYTKVPLEQAVAIYENRGVIFTLERAGNSVTGARFDDPDGNPFVLREAPADPSMP